MVITGVREEDYCWRLGGRSQGCWCTEHGPVTKNHPVPNVGSAEAERLWPREAVAGRGYCLCITLGGAWPVQTTEISLMVPECRQRGKAGQVSRQPCSLLEKRESVLGLTVSPCGKWDYLEG